MQNVRLSTAQMEQLHDRLRRLPDSRKRRGKRHRYTTVLCIALAAVLGGARSYVAIAEWAERLSQSQLRRLRALQRRPRALRATTLGANPAPGAAKQRRRGH